MNRQAPVIWQPQPRQRAFMERPEPEALYGGAAGGGQSGAPGVAGLPPGDTPPPRGAGLVQTVRAARGRGGWRR